MLMASQQLVAELRLNPRNFNTEQPRAAPCKCQVGGGWAFASYLCLSYQHKAIAWKKGWVRPH